MAPLAPRYCYQIVKFWLILDATAHRSLLLPAQSSSSLGRLWQWHGKPSEAQRLVAEVYGWFTEGFDTADLQEAKALLEELV